MSIVCPGNTGHSSRVSPIHTPLDCPGFEPYGIQGLGQWEQSGSETRLSNVSRGAVEFW